MLHARQGQGKAYSNVSDTAQLFTTPRCTDEEARACIPHEWLGAQSSEPGLPVPVTLCLVRHPCHTPVSHRPTDKTLVRLSIRVLCCLAVAPSLGILDTGMEQT